jgi:outer membrane protein assembly factor BamB
MAIAAQSTPTPSVRPPLALFPTKSLWTLGFNRQLSVPPAYDAEHIYFATDDGRVVAYELARGTEVWHVTASPRDELTAGDGLLFIVEPDRITARRAADGELAWQMPFADTLASPPVSGFGRLVVATRDGAMLQFRASDGQLIWRRELPSPARSRLVLGTDRVYVPTDNGHLVVLEAATGGTIWERRLGGMATDLLALDDRVYVGATDNFLYCLGSRDGRIEWRWRTGADVIGVPVVDDRNVYFVSLDNVLRALSRTTGVQQWFRPLAVRPTAGPIKAGITLVVPGSAPTLPAYDAKDGRPAGTLSAGTGEAAALVHLVSNETAASPAIVIVTHDVKGVTAALVTRQP